MTVHVMGPPEKRDARGFYVMNDDEALCAQPDASDHAVVFHTRSTQIEGGPWVCALCGESSGGAP